MVKYAQSLSIKFDVGGCAGSTGGDIGMHVVNADSLSLDAISSSSGDLLFLHEGYSDSSAYMAGS